MTEDCAFCAKFGEHPTRPGSWFDEELWSSPVCAVIAGLGAFRPGYCLIVSRRHYHSFAEMNDAEREAFDSIRHSLASRLERMGGNLLIYENASIGVAADFGACIDHAHWHFLVTPASIDDLVGDLPSYPVHDFDEARRAVFARAASSYCYVQTKKEARLCLPAGPLPSQFVRRRLSEVEGFPGEWDWAVFPRFENVEQTLTLLRGTLADIRR